MSEVINFDEVKIIKKYEKEKHILINQENIKLLNHVDKLKHLENSTEKKLLKLKVPKIKIHQVIFISLKDRLLVSC